MEQRHHAYGTSQAGCHDQGPGTPGPPQKVSRSRHTPGDAQPKEWSINKADVQEEIHDA
ncbi:hypothetical protein StoSoilB5_32570 [Arthrobacter sp. StoSoilB5]|nr:hypothetical protein StoSoilB5_32570 [Arthrobacter sp. StoSoilB5]